LNPIISSKTFLGVEYGCHWTPCKRPGGVRFPVLPPKTWR